MKNGIIIPCYNEAKRLNFEAFKVFISSHVNYILCFVNDGSKDHTLSELLKFQKEMGDRVVVIDLPQNLGKAEAVRSGINYIIKNPKIDTVGFMDADLATGFQDYTRLVSKMNIGRKKMVFGSRKKNEELLMQRTRFRKLASWAVGLFIKLIVGLPIKDTQCGAKVFKRTTASLVFNKEFNSRWLFDVEIFIRLKKVYKEKVLDRIEEVALLKWNEVEGSKITLKDSIKFPVQLLEIAYNYRVKPKVIEMQTNVRNIAVAINPAA